jgi:sugar phosphate isomerase/epimerase
MSFGYCLNTSTIKGQKLDVAASAELAAEVGYTGIEPWVGELDAYVAAGGDLSELGRRYVDLGLSVENLIGFFAWAVDDVDARSAGFVEARRNLELAQEIGCKRLAAAPMGLVDTADADLDAIAERYAELLAIGRDYGVIPMLEFWGVSKTLGTLQEALYVAAACGDRDACVLADVYHIYKGGGSHDAARLLGPQTLGLVHVNDYPAVPPLATITDADRVYTGDGVAPLDQFLGDLLAVGYDGMLSVELFNERYWQLDAADCAGRGLEKLQASVARLTSAG